MCKSPKSEDQEQSKTSLIQVNRITFNSWVSLESDLLHQDNDRLVLQTNTHKTKTDAQFLKQKRSV